MNPPSFIIPQQLLPDNSNLSYSSRRYLRVWAPSAEPNSPIEVLNFTCGEDDIYEVFEKVDNTPPQGDVYLLVKTGDQLTKPYFVLKFTEPKPVATQKLPATALLYGPITYIHEFDAEAAVCSAVSVLFSPKPNENMVPELSGDFRGYSNMPNRASRIKCFQPTLFPDLTSDTWEKILFPIGELVDDLSEPEQANAIDLLCREVYNPITKQSYNILTPLVVITTYPASLDSARNGVYQIIHLMCMHGFDNVEVKISIGSLHRASSTIIQENRQPFMGASLGPFGEGGGSIGGYVRLSKPDSFDSRSLYAMTCHHVVTKGLQPIMNVTSDILHSPSYAMLVRSIEAAKKIRNYWLAEYQQALNLNLHNCSIEIKEKEVATCKTALDDIEKELSRLELMINSNGAGIVLGQESLIESLGLGYTFRSSALAVRSAPMNVKDHGDGGKLTPEMDWALVKVNPGRIEGFPYNTAYPLKRLHSTMECANDTEYIEEDKYIDKFRLFTAETGPALENGSLKFDTIRTCLSNESIVFRIDRKRNVHDGQVNPRRSRTKLDTAGLAYVILHNRLGTHFAVDGDSGSWILDKNASAVGIFFAISDTHSAYCMDMEEVLQDIKETTGYKIDVASVA